MSHWDFGLTAYSVFGFCYHCDRFRSPVGANDIESYRKYIYIWFACNRCQNTGQYNSAYVTLDVWMCLCAFVWNFDASRNLNFAKVNFNWKLHLVIIHVANRKLVFFTFPVKNSLSFSILLENQWKNVDTFIRIDSFVFIFCLCLHRACSFWGNEFLSKSTEKKLKIYSDSFVVCKQ